MMFQKSPLCRVRRCRKCRRTRYIRGENLCAACYIAAYPTARGGFCFGTKNDSNTPSREDEEREVERLIAANVATMPRLHRQGDGAPAAVKLPTVRRVHCRKGRSI